MDHYRLEKAYSALLKRHDATNNAVRQLEEQNRLLKQQIAFLQNKDENLIEKMNFKDEVIHNQLIEVNRKNNENLVEIQELRRKVKELEN